MHRKWTALAVTLTSSALLVTGIAVAQDEESPLHKIMEKVQAKHTYITKNVRTAVAWKKAQKDVTGAADELVKLAKDAKPLGAEPIKAQKQTQKAWDDRMDAFIKEAETFAKLAAQAETPQPAVKKAYSKVSATCTNCHNDFRVEE